MGAGLLFLLVFIVLLTGVFVLSRKAGIEGLGLPGWLADLGALSNVAIWGAVLFVAAGFATTVMEVGSS